MYYFYAYEEYEENMEEKFHKNFSGKKNPLKFEERRITKKLEIARRKKNKKRG